MTEYHPLDLGSHVLGALTLEELAATDDHLVGCERCRASAADLQLAVRLLDSVPPEALLDGAIDNNDLLLRRVLQRGADDHPARRRPHRERRSWTGGLVAAAAVVGVLAGVLSGGIMIGRASSPEQTVALPSGGQMVTAYNSATRVGMTVDLARSADWVAVHGQFTGVAPGSACQIVLVTRAHQRIIAGSWVAPPDARSAIVKVDGSAIVSPADIGSVEVDTMSGVQLVAKSV